MTSSVAGPIRSHTLEQLTNQQLHCQILGHEWSDGPIDDNYTQLNTCPCGVRRVDTLNPDGSLYVRSYNYSGSPGYQLSVNYDRQAKRAERIRRERDGIYVYRQYRGKRFT